MHFREKRYDWLKKQRKSGIFQARILEWVQFNDMKFKTQDHKGYQGGHIHNPVPSGSKSREKNSHHLRAAGESVSSLKITVFPRTWRKRGGIEKNLDLEDICWDLILSSSWHPERVLITGRSGDGIRKDEQRCGCGWVLVYVWWLSWIQMRVLWDEFRWSLAGSDGEVVNKRMGIADMFHQSSRDLGPLISCWWKQDIFPRGSLGTILKKCGFIQVQ